MLASLDLTKPYYAASVTQAAHREISATMTEQELLINQLIHHFQIYQEKKHTQEAMRCTASVACNSIPLIALAAMSLSSLVAGIGVCIALDATVKHCVSPRLNIVPTPVGDDNIESALTDLASIYHWMYKAHLSQGEDVTLSTTFIMLIRIVGPSLPPADVYPFVQEGSWDNYYDPMKDKPREAFMRRKIVQILPRHPVLERPIDIEAQPCALEDAFNHAQRVVFYQYTGRVKNPGEQPDTPNAFSNPSFHSERRIVLPITLQPKSSEIVKKTM